MASWLKINISTPWLQEQSLFTSAKVLAVLNSVLMILIVIANSLYLITLIRKQSLRTTSNVILGALCLSDLLVGLVLQPMSIAQLLQVAQHKFNPQLFIVQIFLIYTLVGLSFLYMAALSCDRYFAVCHPYKYLKYATSTLALKTCGIVLLLFFSSTLITFILSLKYYGILQYLNGTVIGAIGFLVIIVSNYKVLKVVLKHKTKVTVTTDNRNAQNEGMPSRVVDQKRTNAVMILLIVFLICYLPSAFMHHYGAGNYRWQLNSDLLIVYMWVDFLAYLNSFANPLLYCYRLKSIRKAVMETIYIMKRLLF